MPNYDDFIDALPPEKVAQYKQKRADVERAVNAILETVATLPEKRNDYSAL